MLIILLFIFNTGPIIYGHRQINRPMNDQIGKFFVPKTALCIKMRPNEKAYNCRLGIRICESMSLLSNWPHLEQMMMMIRLHHYGLCCRRGCWSGSAAWKHRRDSRHDINTLSSTTANSRIFSGCNQQRSNLTFYGGIHYVYWQGSTCISE